MITLLIKTIMNLWIEWQVLHHFCTLDPESKQMDADSMLLEGKLDENEPELEFVHEKFPKSVAFIIGNEFCER